MVKVLVAALVASVVGVGLLAFEPWRAVTDSTVQEALPVSTGVAVVDASPSVPVTASAPASASAPAPAPASASAPASAPASAATPPTPSAAPADLAQGRFVDAEHGTDGIARVVQLADGRRFVRLEGLDTSDGPDLHVWLSSSPSGGDWGSYDDGRHLALGELKANRGSHNYAIPADAELGGLRSVVIWCDRFNVAFGTAAVALA